MRTNIDFDALSSVESADMKAVEGGALVYVAGAGSMLSKYLDEIEERLFQMNIHEQALFPDMEGLAGLICQKLRLHWK